MDQRLSLLAVLEEQVAQVQLDIYGSLFGLIPHNLDENHTRTFEMILRHLRAAATESRTQLLFCEM